MKITKIVLFSIIVFAAFIAQTTAFHLYSGAPYPDFAVLLAVYGGIRWGKLKGTQFGAAIGLIQDIMSFGSLGANMLAKGMIGFVVGKLYEKFINDSIVTRVLLIIGATFFDFISYGVLSQVFLSVDIFKYLAISMFPQALVNLIASLFFLPLLIWAEQRVDRLNERVEEKIRFSG